MTAPTNPPAKHPPRGTIWLCAVHVDCEDEQIHVAYTHEQFDVGTDYYPYVPAALLQEERDASLKAITAALRQARAEAFEEAGNLCRAWCAHTEAERGPLDVKFFEMAQAARSPGDAEKGE